jgi:Mn2+/Fe2+ NRAMP family transporter
LVFILKLANRRRLLGDAANGPALRVLATVIVAAVSLMSGIVVVQTVLGWFGL